MKQNDQLEPKGTQSTEDVFIGVGYDGAECYMELLVNAPGAGGVRPFSRGIGWRSGEGMKWEMLRGESWRGGW